MLQPPAPHLISPAALDSLRRTRGWTLFMAILFILGAVAMVGMGVIYIIMGLVMGATMQSDLGFEAAGMATGFQVVSGIANLIFGLIYIIPAVLLFRFIGSIPTAVGTGDPAAFVAAMEAQRRIWKSFGILTIIYIGLMILLFIGFVIFGAATFGAISDSF